MGMQLRPKLAAVFLAGMVISIGACAGNSQKEVDAEPMQELSVPSRSPRSGVKPQDLMGVVDIELRVTENVQRDSVIRGTLTLMERAVVDADLFSDARLYGWTTIPAEQLGDLSDIASPLWSRDPAQPGVMAFVDPEGHVWTIRMGVVGEYPSICVHCGITLYLIRPMPGGFSGFWAMGANRAPAGQFDLRRRQ